MPPIPSKQKAETATPTPTVKPVAWAPAAEANTWRDSRVLVAVTYDKVTLVTEVQDAQVYGANSVVAVWAGRGVRVGKWVAGHLGTGLLLSATTSVEDAKRICERLVRDSACRSALLLRDKNEVKALLPEWVEPWCKACESEDKYLEPSV
jgi:hypothetical protein